MSAHLPWSRNLPSPSQHSSESSQRVNRRGKVVSHSLQFPGKAESWKDGLQVIHDYQSTDQQNSNLICHHMPRSQIKSFGSIMMGNQRRSCRIRTDVVSAAGNVLNEILHSTWQVQDHVERSAENFPLWAATLMLLTAISSVCFNVGLKQMPATADAEAVRCNLLLNSTATRLPISM